MSAIPADCSSRYWQLVELNIMMFSWDRSSFFLWDPGQLALGTVCTRYTLQNKMYSQRLTSTTSQHHHNQISLKLKNLTNATPDKIMITSFASFQATLQPIFFYLWIPVLQVMPNLTSKYGLCIENNRKCRPKQLKHTNYKLITVYCILAYRIQAELFCTSDCSMILY